MAAFLWGEMVAVTLSSLYATGYAGVPPSTLGPALAALPIKHEEFTFVDIGCGKGRALFIAAEFPFRRIVGAELAVELAQIARANVALNPAWRERISIANVQNSLGTRHWFGLDVFSACLHARKVGLSSGPRGISLLPATTAFSVPYREDTHPFYM
jgi:SAM-dependent methyltransferase